jgi:hypothetical protein
MKKLALSLIALLSLHPYTYSYYTFEPSTSDHLQAGSLHAGIGAVLLATALYSMGETLLDCGHGYYELKKEYLRYLLELETLEHGYILSEKEKHFWAINQMISKAPRVFWREFVAGSFSLFTAALAYKYLGKSVSDFSKAL